MKKGAEMKTPSKYDLWREIDGLKIDIEKLRAQLDLAERLLHAERERIVSVAGVLDMWGKIEIGNDGPKNWAEYKALKAKTQSLAGKI